MLNNSNYSSYKRLYDGSTLTSDRIKEDKSSSFLLRTNKHQYKNHYNQTVIENDSGIFIYKIAAACAIKSLQNDIRLLVAERDQLKDEVKYIKSKTEEEEKLMKEDCENAKIKLTEILEKVKKQEIEYDKLKKDCERLRNDNEILTIEFERLNKFNQSLESELYEARKKSEEFEKVLFELL